jgi:hypothetical protein
LDASVTQPKPFLLARLIAFPNDVEERAWNRPKPRETG